MSAVARICIAFPTLIDLSSVVPVWVVGLPVTHDEAEAPTVYTWLAYLLASQPQLVLGQAGERSAFIADALKAAVNQQGLLPDPLKQQISLTLHKLQ